MSTKEQLDYYQVRDKRPEVKLRTTIKSLGTKYEGAAASGPMFEKGQTSEMRKFIIQRRKAEFEEFLI